MTWKEREEICVLWGQLGAQTKGVTECLKLVGERNVRILQRLATTRSSPRPCMKVDFCFCRSPSKENNGVQGRAQGTERWWKEWQNKCWSLKCSRTVLSAGVSHGGVCSECAVLVLQVLSGGRVLALTSAQISDTGKYTCVAVNAAGESQRDIDLRVYGKIFWQIPDFFGHENCSWSLN